MELLRTLFVVEVAHPRTSENAGGNESSSLRHRQCRGRRASMNGQPFEPQGTAMPRPFRLLALLSDGRYPSHEVPQCIRTPNLTAPQVRRGLRLKVCKLSQDRGIMMIRLWVGCCFSFSFSSFRCFTSPVRTSTRFDLPPRLVLSCKVWPGLVFRTAF